MMTSSIAFALASLGDVVRNAPARSLKCFTKTTKYRSTNARPRCAPIFVSTTHLANAAASAFIFADPPTTPRAVAAAANIPTTQYPIATRASAPSARRARAPTSKVLTISTARFVVVLARSIAGFARFIDASLTPRSFARVSSTIVPRVAVARVPRAIARPFAARSLLSRRRASLETTRVAICRANSNRPLTARVVRARATARHTAPPRWSSPSPAAPCERSIARSRSCRASVPRC